MAVRFRKPRTIIIAVITVALSVGIVFATLPLLQHPVSPHGSLTTPITQPIGPGTSTSPGHTQLRLPGLPSNESFVVSVSVTNGNATFCALDNFHYQSWVSSGFAYGSFPRSSCIVYEQTAQDTLTFVPTTAGDWFLVAFNYSPKTLSVLFAPA